MQLPVQLQEAFERELERIPSSQLVLASVELTASYRDPQRSKPPPISSGAQHLAYAAVRMPATYAAVYAVFSELKARQPGLQVSTLLDLGAGPGTAAWAAAELFPELKRVTSLEQESGLIELGSRLASEFPFRPDWVQQDLRRFDAARYDLVILSYVIGELAPGDVVNVIQRAWNVTAGALVVIEPGTPVGYQRIMAVRDLLMGTAEIWWPRARICVSARCCISAVNGAISPLDWDGHRSIVASKQQNSDMKTRNSPM